MKKIQLFMVSLMTLSLMTLFVACEKDEEIDLTTISVSKEQFTPSYTSAAIQCSLNTKATLRNVYVQYATTQDFAEYEVRAMSKVDGVYSVVLDSLQDNTTYYVRYAVSNRYSSAITKEISTFQTLQPSIPTIALKSISDIWDTHAKAQIALDFDGGSQISEMGICWDTKTAPTVENNKLTTKNTNATLEIKNLLPNTRYFVRAYAVNKVGVAYSDEYEFLTYALPEIKTEEITDVQSTTALLKGTFVFDGNDTAAIRGFCWSTNEEPTIEDEHIEIDTTSATYTYRLSNLNDETQYYVRAYAQNKIGTIYGESKSFTTQSAVIPTVTTTSATNITYTSVTIGGNVTSDGGATATERGVVYSTTQDPTTSNSKVTSGSGIGSFSCSLSNLQDNTTYFVRAYAINKKGTAYGEQKSFTTNAYTLPVVATSAATNITYTSATIGGNVTNDGGTTVSERGVVYSTTQNPTISNSKVTSGNGTGLFSCSLTNLQDSTTYYVRAYAINKKGVSYGEEKSFTTNAYTLPVVITVGVSNVSYTSALVSGNVTNDGGANVTERGVVYATNPNPTTVDNKATSGSGTGSFTCSLSDLQGATTYYVRAYAINKKGTTYGEESSFTTRKPHEYVDLGLSVKWATCNIGASNPEEYGYYFAWGETQPKSTYNWDTYVWYNGIDVTKYDNYSGGDGKTILDLSDDAAYVNWGDGWRMPTEAEQQELVDNCTWISETRNGINGYKVISNKAGYKDKSIFIPATGYMRENKQEKGNECDIWSSTLFSGNPQYAICLVYDFYSVGLYGHDRFLGRPVRPVYGARTDGSTAPTVITQTVSQVTETTAVAGGNVTSNGGASVTERGVVYSTNPNPVITNLSNTIRPCGSGIGAFTYTMTGLQPSTTYYVRAYATNANGTAYGEVVSFTTSSLKGTHEYVDLGLSVKWATCNVGADKPEDYGDYFAWGEIEPKSSYSSSNYTYTSNPTTLPMSNDAARVNWGGSWRMPTKAEQDELRNECTWTWTAQNGVKGYKVTSKSNGNSIFIPAAGDCYGSSLYDVGSKGYYWSNSLYDNSSYAYYLSFTSNDVSRYSNDRFRGQSVRPVCP